MPTVHNDNFSKRRLPKMTTSQNDNFSIYNFSNAKYKLNEQNDKF